MDSRRYLDEPEADMAEVVRPVKRFPEGRPIRPRIPFDDDDFREQAITIGKGDQRIEVPLSTREQAAAVLRIVNGEDEADRRTFRHGQQLEAGSPMRIRPSRVRWSRDPFKMRRTRGGAFAASSRRKSTHTCDASRPPA